MRLGNWPQLGDALELHRWYFRLDILKCPPNMIHCIKPYICVWFVKFSDFGEQFKVDGRQPQKIGGHWDYLFPFGIVVDIRII